MNFIKSPNLPQNKVTLVLISSEVEKSIINEFEKTDIEVITVPPCTDIQKQVSSHPDMLFHHLGGNKIVCYKNADESVCKKLCRFGFELIKNKNSLLPNYPNDIALNAARVNNHLLCSKNYVDDVILNYCSKNNLHIINVKQGYAKCSTAIVDENSIITADSSIEAEALKNGIDVLKIREGFINLPGYDYGFIGGCCGKLVKNELAFCGDIKKHPDYNVIENFLVKRGIKIKMLGTQQLRDIGSIIPLMEL